MAAGATAGPSTALRSGRDDNFVTDRKRCDGTVTDLVTELSSRPERSAVEEPAVAPFPLTTPNLAKSRPSRIRRAPCGINATLSLPLVHLLQRR